MQHFQTSFFYDLQELIRHSPLLRKYYYIFKALDLSALPDRNNGVGATGHSRHAIIICLVEKTLPNNITDAQVALSLMKELKRRFRFKKGAIFIADKAYDVRELYTFIVNKMKSQPYIPINPRNQKEDKTFGIHGGPVCDAGIEMKSAGKWTEGYRQRLKFRCPLKTSKKVAAEFDNVCPAKHTSFDTGKCYGCTKYLDVTDDARSRVPRDSKEFKEVFRHRQVVEQYFSRLGDREAEQTTHYSFTAISNQMTIAHLTASLVAVAAAILLRQPTKMRCYRTFAYPPKHRDTG